MKPIAIGIAVAFTFGLYAGDMKIYYMPFAMKTSDVITAATIEKDAFVTVVVKSMFKANEITRLIKPSNAKIKNKHIRLKLVINKDVYFFDTGGVGLKNQAESVIIDKNLFENIISLDRICFNLN